MNKTYKISLRAKEGNSNDYRKRERQATKHLVNFWNTMTRKEIIAAKNNLRGADLRGADLFSADLRGADLRGAFRF